MTKHILLSSPKSDALARRVVEYNKEIVLGKINWKGFNDTFPNTFIENVAEVQAAHVSFLACFDTPHTIFEQVSVIYALAELRPQSFKIILPYFPTGTMERVDHEGQVATASTLAQMLSAVSPAGPGSVPLYTFDIHALGIRHYFGPNISPQFKTGTKMLKRKIEGQNMSLVFPDEGSWKRFRSMFEDNDHNPLFPFIICRKVRDGDRRMVTISEGEVKGKDTVILDDLIHSGSTTIECFHALRVAGAKSISAYATHGVMENDAWKKFLDIGFQKVWITDSCPTAEIINGQGPFEMISIAEPIANAVMA